MPNRILRDWTDSERVNSVSLEGQAFFTRLIMKVDDFGLFVASPRLLRPALFPISLDAVSEKRITDWLKECQEANLIDVYQVGDKEYLQILRFRNPPRALKSKFPFKGASPDWVEPQTQSKRRASAPETESGTGTEKETELPQTPSGGSGGRKSPSSPEPEGKANNGSLAAELTQRLNAGLPEFTTPFNPAKVADVLATLPATAQGDAKRMRRATDAYIKDQRASSKQPRDPCRSFRSFLERKLCPGSTNRPPHAHSKPQQPTTESFNSYVGS